MTIMYIDVVRLVILIIVPSVLLIGYGYVALVDRMRQKKRRVKK